MDVWLDVTKGAPAFIGGVPRLIVPGNPNATNAVPFFGSAASLAHVRAWLGRPERAVCCNGSAIEAGPSVHGGSRC